MLKISISEAETNLSELIKLLENKKEDIVYITRNDKCIAKLTPANVQKSIIGVAKGKFEVPEDFDSIEYI